MNNVIYVDFKNKFSNVDDFKIIIDNDNLLDRHEFKNWNNATDYINSLIDSVSVEMIYIIVQYNGSEIFRRLENDNLGYMDNLYDSLLESISDDIFFLQNTDKGQEYSTYTNPYMLDGLIEDFQLLSNF